MADLRTRIAALRSRLRSLSLSSLVRSPSVHNGGLNTALPSSKEALDTQSRFAALAIDAATFPTTVEDSIVDSELQSLRFDLNNSRTMVQRLIHLGNVYDKVAACDHALSDLLEHADTYPAAPPAQHLASPHISDARLPCEEQLASRVAFTKATMCQLNEACVAVTDDSRVVAEQIRLTQTWSELADMCTDRINGTRSRPASSVSSTGGNSGAASSSLSHRDPKPSLSGSALRPRHSESITRPRPMMSSSHDPIGRPSTHMSNRSVSGPSGSSSLFNTTFASRQRTSSLASIQSAISSPFKRPISPVTRSRVTHKRPGSPTFSEMSGQSLVSTPSRSTWSRAPRQSFGTVPRSVPTRETPVKRKAYVANPRSKLDIAVGHVVNNFRLPVTIHAASDSWKDQSGKYWIGDAEPKLCFCRILRSQTVMVRVGGGWCELSK
jgi:Growth-Arrest-Specific Protein 2 Domain